MYPAPDPRIQQVLVDDHVAGLRREADEARRARRLPAAELGAVRRARVRLGHTLVHMGRAIAGTQPAHG